MNKEKQIEEMANDHFAELGKMDKEKQIKETAREVDKWYPNAKITNRFLSESLYNAGYRKASEIFEEIEEVISQSNEISDIRMRDLAPHTYKVMREAGKLYYTAIIRAIAELKKKYTEEGK